MNDKDKDLTDRPEEDDEGGSSQGSFRPDELLFYGQSEDETGGESGETGGGQAGEIIFRYRDAMSLPPRDDVLPPEEIKRLLTVHKETHKQGVDKQKQSRKERRDVKEGKITFKSQHQGMGYGRGGYSQYKTHPVSLKAQFSGIDKQVVGIANLNEAETNEKLKDALENRLENRLQLQHAPKFNPRPSGPGGMGRGG